jgi:hypothetical protein
MVSGVSPSGPRLTRGGRGEPRRLRAAAAVALCLMGGGAHAGDGPREPHDHHHPRQGGYPIKASHLAKFPAFVVWPDTAFETTASPFRLCVGGQDPFGLILERFTSDARVGDHPMTVTRLPLVSKTADCHVLFVSASRGQTPREMLAAVAGRPVLTVADDGLDAPGAMIQFVSVGGRVRFEIHADAALAEGLTVSSKLLSLSAPRGGGER